MPAHPDDPTPREDAEDQKRTAYIERSLGLALLGLLLFALALWGA